MSGKRFSVGAWVLSLAGALLGAGLCLISWGVVNTMQGRILSVGSLLLAIYVGGFLGMNLALLLSRKYKVRRRKFWIVSFLLSGAAIFVMGVVGQALFMYSKEEVTIPTTVDIVLLLDASGSMAADGYDVPRTDAAIQFVESLEESSRLQTVSFAGRVLGRSQLLYMDDDGKAELTDFINSIDALGTTDFDAPLNAAMETLENEGRDDSRKAVILLTDAGEESSLSDDVIASYCDSDILVFTIRISSDSTKGVRARALAQLAEDTGGFDTQLKPASDGSVDATEMLEAFQNAFAATTETQTVMSKDNLLYTPRVSMYQFLVRLITLVLCALFFGFGYFGRWSLKCLIPNALGGLANTVLLGICGASGNDLCLIFPCIFLASAIVCLEGNGGDVIDV